MNKIIEIADAFNTKFKTEFTNTPEIGLEHVAKLAERGITDVDEFQHMISLKKPFLLRMHVHLTSGKPHKCIQVSSRNNVFLRFSNDSTTKTTETGIIELYDDDSTYEFAVGEPDQMYSIAIEEMNKTLKIKAGDISEDMMLQYMTLYPENVIKVLEAIQYFADKKISFPHFDCNTIQIDFKNIDSVYDAFVLDKELSDDVIVN